MSLFAGPTPGKSLCDCRGVAGDVGRCDGACYMPGAPRDPHRLEKEDLDAIRAERDRYRHGLELILRESEQFPDEDGIGAGTMARNLLKGSGC